MFLCHSYSIIPILGYPRWGPVPIDLDNWSCTYTNLIVGRILHFQRMFICLYLYLVFMTKPWQSRKVRCILRKHKVANFYHRPQDVLTILWLLQLKPITLVQRILSSCGSEVTTQFGPRAPTSGPKQKCCRLIFFPVSK